MPPETLRTLRIIRFAAIAALVVLFATMAAMMFLRQPAKAFSLTSMNGGTFNGESLKGKPYAMFFGFTHCPDVCPTTMQEVADTLTAAGDAAKDFQVLFVTIDPARDTPELLKTYLGAFDPRILGLTGSEAEIAALATRNNIIVEKVGGGDSYTFNHTASVLLFDKEGRLAGTLSPSDTPEDRVKKLQRLLRNDGSTSLRIILQPDRLAMRRGFRRALPGFAKRIKIRWKRDAALRAKPLQRQHPLLIVGQRGRRRRMDDSSKCGSPFGPVEQAAALQRHGDGEGLRLPRLFKDNVTRSRARHYAGSR